MPIGFEPTAGSDECDPWEWLAAAVTADGEGYKLLSPAGGVMVISNEQRERMVACVNFLRDVPTEILQSFPDGADAVALLACQEYVKRRKLNITGGQA